MKGRINGSGLGFTSGFCGGSPGRRRLALSTSASLWDRDLSIKRRVTTDIDYKLLLRGIHTTRIMTTNETMRRRCTPYLPVDDGKTHIQYLIVGISDEECIGSIYQKRYLLSLMSQLIST